MRIVCPSCDTAYDAPESVVATGKVMRCARCRTEWSPGKPDDRAPSATSPLANTPEYMPDYHPLPEPAATQHDSLFAPSSQLRTARPAEPPLAEAEPVILAPFPDPLPPPEPVKKTVIAAWAASVVVLVIVFWLAIAYRQPIMRGWPASARVYAALGYK